MTSSELAVATDGLTKRFGDFTAVSSLDLQVPAGTVVSILGPNGAGKTTTVRMLATLVEPTAGTALVCGHDVVAEADAVRQVISLTGQFAALEDKPHVPREPRAHGPVAGPRRRRRHPDRRPARRPVRHRR